MPPPRHDEHPSTSETSKERPSSKKAEPRVEMRRRREELGYTREKAAEAIGVSVSTWKGWENGTQNPLPGNLPYIARVLLLPTPEVQSWFSKTGTKPKPITVSDLLGLFASLEQGAPYMWTFSAAAVPGLLQTSAYAAAVASVRPGTLSEADVLRNVEVRLARQAVLSRAPDPLELTAIIHESVLGNEAGGADVMADQLAHLVRMAGMPNVELRILSRRSGYFPFGSFTLVGSAEAEEPVTACVEKYRGVSYRERRDGLEDLVELYCFLRELALPPAASVELIERVAKELYE